MSVIQITPEDRKSIKDMVVELTICLEKIDKQKQHMKDIGEVAKDKFAMKPATLNKMAKTMYKESFADLQAENEAFAFLYEAVVKFHSQSAADVYDIGVKSESN